ncbi:hypothetical protein CEXT_5331 [Caerostris extrusa]|uniref:Uncharacterized protein n=1 Tax=Caerostris extrusa TaxID=172846 RepID=A0AAV4S396_CAEEX|nr:hypothetical protein CEXT_5331 [Caerostris extrusa]
MLLRKEEGEEGKGINTRMSLSNTQETIKEVYKIECRSFLLPGGCRIGGVEEWKLSYAVSKQFITGGGKKGGCCVALSWMKYRWKF